MSEQVKAALDSRRFYVKCRDASMKRSKMLARDGLTNLRVHAITVTGSAKAEAFLAEMRLDNPDWTFELAEIKA